MVILVHIAPLPIAVIMVPVHQKERLRGSVIAGTKSGLIMIRFNSEVSEGVIKSCLGQCVISVICPCGCEIRQLLAPVMSRNRRWRCLPRPLRCITENVVFISEEEREVNP